MHQLCTNFAPTFSPRMHQLCTNFSPRMHQLCTNFSPKMHQLFTNNEPNMHQLFIQKKSSTLNFIFYFTSISHPTLQGNLFSTTHDSRSLAQRKVEDIHHLVELPAKKNQTNTWLRCFFLLEKFPLVTQYFYF